MRLQLLRCNLDLSSLYMHDNFFTTLSSFRKLHLTSLCVNQRTSSCDFYTRADVSKTFNQISTIIKDVCTPSPPTTPSTSCLPQGEVIQCDLEEALICMVPVQAMLLHPNSTWEQVCRQAIYVVFFRSLKFLYFETLFRFSPTSFEICNLDKRAL
jgi:hypothetical protein